MLAVCYNLMMIGQVEWIYPGDDRVKPQTVAHHRARYKYVLEICPPTKSRTSALDLACGSGYGTEMLRQAGYKATGIDISKDAIDYAQIHYPKCSFVRSNLNDTEVDGYNIIVFFESLEHITRRDGLKLFNKVSECFLNNGVFFVSVSREPNPGHKRYHKSRWSYLDFKKSLETSFKFVDIVGQDWDTAQISSENVQSNDFYIGMCSNSS